MKYCVKIVFICLPRVVRNLTIKWLNKEVSRVLTLPISYTGRFLQNKFFFTVDGVRVKYRLIFSIVIAPYSAKTYSGRGRHYFAVTVAPV